MLSPVVQLVPSEAGQGWKLDMFEFKEPMAIPASAGQRQCILVADGELIAFQGEDLPIVIKSGQLVFFDPGKLKSLTPIGKACFFSLEMSEVSYQEYPPIDPQYFGCKIQRPENYWVYDLVAGSATEERWSLALIEIHDSPQHFHRIESEQFIVVCGVLAIEIDGVHHTLHVGQSIETKPGMVHQLKSASENPVRVLCFSHPAFDPSDKYYVLDPKDTI